MHMNMGSTDRLVRLIVAALAWWLAASIGYATAGGVVVLVLAGILAITGVVGYCPLYAALRLTSRHGMHRMPATR
jgi:hypothetical protein